MHIGSTNATKVYCSLKTLKSRLLAKDFFLVGMVTFSTFRGLQLLPEEDHSGNTGLLGDDLRCVQSGEERLQSPGSHQGCMSGNVHLVCF